MKPIQTNAPASCAKTIRIHAPAQKIWAVLTDINQWPAWQTDIAKTSHQGPLEAGAGFTWKTGGISIQSVLHTVEPCQAMGWTGKTMGLRAIHNWKLTETKDSTEVSVEESMEGLLVALFKRAFQNNLDAGMQQWLKLLKKECEK